MFLDDGEDWIKTTLAVAALVVLLSLGSFAVRGYLQKRRTLGGGSLPVPVLSQESPLQTPTIVMPALRVDGKRVVGGRVPRISPSGSSPAAPLGTGAEIPRK